MKHLIFKHSTYILTFFCLLSFSNLNAQKNGTSQNQISSVKDGTVEKVYLFTDRSSYFTGEDIWFNAFLIESFSNCLFDHSINLYVELISPEAKILQRIAVRLENGTGHGDFHLGDSIPSGRYLLRAYTNWMQNFDESFFYTKEINVESLLGYKNETKFSTSANELDVQLFPEGGSLLEDVYSVVGLKAVNSSGWGVDIKGVVYSSDNDSVKAFESTHLGMGFFEFSPRKGVKYHAKGSDSKGNTFDVPIPEIASTGFAMRVLQSVPDQVSVVISTNKATLDQLAIHELMVSVISRGSLCVFAKIKIKKYRTVISLPKNEFPEGIASINLSDSLGRPICERLIFISKNMKLQTSIKSDKNIYSKREKVELSISVNDSLGMGIAASFALSAADSTLSQFEHGIDIVSYLFLQSEIKGNIEQPSLYFDSQFPNRLKALDILLLTQGWRDFIWKKQASAPVVLKYPVERGFKFSGLLRHSLAKKPIPNANISMGLFGRELELYFTKTDSAGLYSFKNIDFIGDRTVVISAMNKDLKSKGWISLNPLYTDPAKLNLNFPTADIEKVEEIVPQIQHQLELIRKYKLTDTIQIEEVVVKGKKSNEPTDDGHFRMYGTPDYSIQVKDEMMNYSDIFQLLQARVPGLMIMGSFPNMRISIRGAQQSPIFLLDGSPIELDFVGSISVMEVDKIEVLKNAANLAVFGIQGANGAISIFTKTGTMGNVKPVLHSINMKVDGFYKARKFYSPNYSVPMADYLKPDFRATIHWEPEMRTDSNGNASVSFYNSDSQSKVNIQIEGITSAGIPFVEKGSYKVE